MQLKRGMQDRVILLVTIWLVPAIAGALWIWSRAHGSHGVERTRAPNNPNDFYLWATDSVFTYTFRYDPRAADGWLFRSAGGVQVATGAATAEMTIPK